MHARVKENRLPARSSHDAKKNSVRASNNAAADPGWKSGTVTTSIRFTARSLTAAGRTATLPPANRTLP